MVHIFFRGVLASLMVVFAVSPVMAASFLLPDDAILDVRKFSFPARTDDYVPDAEFHDQLVAALQQSGMTVYSPDGERSAPPSADPEALRVTPLTADSSTSDVSAAAKSVISGVFAAPLPDGGNGAGTDPAADGAPKDTANGSGNAPAAENVPNETPEADKKNDAGASDGTAAPFSGATHILQGRVTMFQESAGAPTRVGSSIRIRTEVSLHCTYTVKDTRTGNVIISDVASGSAARVVGEAQDIDAAIAALRSRAVAMATAAIAANLSGTPGPDQGRASEREYYQDSPGKRLKQNN